MSEMWEIEKRFTFEAAHMLPHHDGKCQRLHGHSWKGSIIVRSEKLISSGPKIGMVMDYGDIKAVLQPLIDDYLDHHDLNKTTGLENPTSEALAKWLYDVLRLQIPWIVCVTIEETCTSAARYYPDPTLAQETAQ